MELKRCHGCMRMKQNSPICEHCGFDERRANASHQLPIGTVLRDQYLIGKVLGQGGFGITYLGRDIRLDIPVAIKEYYPAGMVMRESTVDRSVTVVAEGEDTHFLENRDRFLREAQILAKLEDVDEVVQVKNFFEENGTAYIVMGYVKGITLKEYMRRNGGKLTVSETFRLLQPLMQALGQVHELGLVHRDISPDNIMIQPNGRARLIDFGAAHTATAFGDKSTQAVLKHGYAPPEQYQSKGQLGPWTDVYAVCATVYHCITGLMPPNITDRIMGEGDFEWTALQGMTPCQLETIKRGLAVQREQRIQSMDELSQGLLEGITLQPRMASMQPSASEAGTVTLHPGTVSHSLTVAPTPEPYTEPVIRQEPYYTAPVVRQPEPYTAPVIREAPPAASGETKTRESRTASGRGKWLLLVGVLVILLPLLILFCPNAAEDAQTPEESPILSTQPQVTQPVVTQPAPTEAAVSRVLMNPGVIWQEETDGESTWYFYDPSIQYAFGTKALREEVASITFLDTTRDAPGDAVDASQEQDCSVLAWVIPNGELYDLYLAADGKISAPEDCTELFAFYDRATSIRFGNAFDTSNVTNMNYMFGDCYRLTELDMSGINTSNVAIMGYMFRWCESLAELDVSELDTGNATWMCGMFEGCTSLTNLDVSGFDTSNVYDMGHMFRYCYSLTELDLSGFDTSNVEGMPCMFLGTTELKNVNADFDVRNVASYQEFMDPGDTFNGRPWEELFQ